MVAAAALEVQNYLDVQEMARVLEQTLNQVVKEKAENGPRRMAELLEIAARDHEAKLRMHKLFAGCDSDGDGLIDEAQLKEFMESMGEPLSLAELKATFAEISTEGSISFKAATAWYQRERARGGALSHRGEGAVVRKTRAARASRTSKERANVDEQAASFDIMGCRAVPVGEPHTLEFRVQLHAPDGGAVLPEDGGGTKQISPWHDVPLYPLGGRDAGIVHMVVEIPKFSRAKFEIATGEELNAIKQDTKSGKLREYNYGDMLFNYGAFPQTWEDPTHTTPDTGAVGDNDPIDAIEIGTLIRPVGSVIRVKVLGCLAMIDDGETDWKVICISVDDPLAERLHDIDDVEAQMPGYIGVLREWLRMYKTVDGKPQNEFGLDGRAMDRAYTMRVIDETHSFWKALIDKGQKTV
jgi:inorganic pyrophosphatase